MNLTVPCNMFRCTDECDEHAYCDKHYQQQIEEAYESGKKEGYEDAKEEFKS